MEAGWAGLEEREEWEDRGEMEEREAGGEREEECGDGGIVAFGVAFSPSSLARRGGDGRRGRHGRMGRMGRNGSLFVFADAFHIAFGSKWAKRQNGSR